MVEFVVVAAAAYAALLIAVYGLQRHMMYFPARAVPDPAAAGVPELAPVRIATADGLELLSWYRPPARPAAPVLVYFHGNAGHIGDRGYKVRPYLDAGLGVLLVGYRGYGGNPGSPTERGLFADGRAALAFLAKSGIEAGRTVLYGESLGSGIAVMLAAERPVGALVLEAPFTSAADVGARAYPFLPIRLLIRDRFDSLSRISAIAAPLLIVHGERDMTVPAALGRRLLAAAPEPKEGRFFAAADHNDLYEHGAASAVLDFLERRGLLPGPAGTGGNTSGR